MYGIVEKYVKNLCIREKVGDEGVREKKDEGTIFYGVRTSG